MTDEELKNIEQTTALLVENGFVIKDTASFINHMGGESLEDVISKLNSLQKNLNEGVNAEDFSKDIAVSLDEVEDVIQSDMNFKTSPEAASFENLLKHLKDESQKSYRNTLKAEEILKVREENLKDIEKRISDLKKDKTLDDVKRTSETIKLSFALNHAKESLEESLNFYNEQKALSEKPLLANDIVSYKNELLKIVNALDNSFRKLSMEPDKMEKLAASIRDTRDKIVLFGFEAQKNKEEFDKLCKKFGLEKIHEKIEVKEEVKEEIIEEEIIEEVNKDIVNVYQLVSELKMLNPEIDVIRDGEVDEILVEDPAKLVLPKGFKYDEKLGVNNKIDDVTPYISAFVKTKERNIEKMDEESTLVNEEKKESRIPSGKLSFKRTRRAIVAPYVKAILCYGALGGILTAGVGIGLAAVGTGLTLGASVGVVGQKIYHKLVDKGILEVSELDDLSDRDKKNYEMPVVGSLIVKDASSLLSKITKSKAKKHEEIKNEEPIKEPVLEESEVLQEDSLEEDKKPKLFENFKNMFSSSLDNEIDTLEPKEKEVNESAPALPVEEYFLENAQINLDEIEQKRGGR